MKLTNAKSAPVLDKASAFEKKLNWELFCMEQEQKLYSDPGTWIPGNPIHIHPWTRANDEFDDPGEFNAWAGPPGNHVRPMIQELKDSHLPMTCKKCEVSGDRDDTNCWFCGAGFPRRVYADMEKFMEPELNRDRIQAQVYAINTGMDELGRTLSEAMRRLGEGVRLPVSQSHRGMNGFTINYVVVDEFAAFQRVWLAANTPDGFGVVERYEPPVPSRSIFEVREQPIELVCPVAADLSVPVDRVVHIPEDVDLSGRMIPELPSLDPPEVSIVDHGYRIPPASEIRRSY